MITIGIDIGLTGAVALVGHDRYAVHDMPTLPDGKGQRIDGRKLILLLRSLIAPGETALIVFEDVRPRSFGNGGKQTNSMHSQGSMMRSRGIVEAVADIARMPVKIVQPQTWKRHFGLLKPKGEAAVGWDGKKASLEIARRLFPRIPAALKMAKHHNRAESLLMAQFAHETA